MAGRNRLLGEFDGRIGQLMIRRVLSDLCVIVVLTGLIGLALGGVDGELKMMAGGVIGYLVVLCSRIRSRIWMK